MLRVAVSGFHFGTVHLLFVYYQLNWFEGARLMAL